MINLSSTNGRSLDYLANQVSPWVSRYAAGSIIAPHSHEQLQILYANSGTMQLRAEGEACIINSGRAVVIPPGLEHEIRMNGHTEMATLYVGDLRGSPLLDGISSITVSPMMKHLLLTTIDRSAMPYFSASRNFHLLGLLFEEIHTDGIRRPSISVPRDRRAAQVCEKVLANLFENQPLEELADQVGASSRTINRIFKRELKLSFCEWRQQVRINYAIDALHQGRPVSEIAFELGYSSLSSFSYAFRKQVGQSPSAFAKNPIRLWC